MIIDCDECAMQHTSACSDCVVSVFLARSGGRWCCRTTSKQPWGTWPTAVWWHPSGWFLAGQTRRLPAKSLSRAAAQRVRYGGLCGRPATGSTIWL